MGIFGWKRCEDGFRWCRPSVFCALMAGVCSKPFLSQAKSKASDRSVRPTRLVHDPVDSIVVTG